MSRSKENARGRRAGDAFTRTRRAAIEALEARTLFAVDAPTVAFVEPAAPQINTAGTPAEFVGVIYKDSVGINPATINVGNLTTDQPNDVRVAGAVVVANVDGLLAAIYELVPVRASAWYPADNANVNISLDAADPVVNTRGTPVAAGALTSFQIAISPDDTSFGTGGTSNVQFVANGSTTDAEGDTLLTGTVTSASGTSGVIARLTPAGQLDPTFGTNGIVVTPGPADIFNAIQTEGEQIVVVGSTQSQFLVARYNHDGTLDKFYKEPVIDGFSQEAFALSVSPTNGSILAAGVSEGHYTFFRFNSDGSFDQTFGGGGGIIGDFSLPGGLENIGKTLLQPNGDILAVGALNNQIVAFRLLPNGANDPTFNNGVPVIVPGLAATESNTLPPDPTEGLAVEGNQILVSNHTADGHFGVVRLNADGSVDATFGQNGLAEANFGGTDDADTVLVQPSGQIVVTGTTINSAGAAGLAIAAFLPNGALDTSFNGTGLLTLGQTATAAVAHPAGTVSPFAIGIADANLLALAASRNDGRIAVSFAQNGQTATRLIATDQTPPTAAVSDAPLTTSGAGSYSFNVVYTDNTRVQASTIAASNVTVQAPSGAALTVTGVMTSVSTDGKTVTATYTVAAPNGQFSAADNGSYTIGVSGQVTDAAGNPVTATPNLGAFNVAIGVVGTPGGGGTGADTLIGAFPTVSGNKPKKLALVTASGNLGTITLKGGTGQAFLAPDGHTVDLTLSSPGTLTIPGSLTLGNVTVTGNILSLSAPRASLTGTLSATGAIGKLTLGSTSGAIIAAASSIASVKVGGAIAASTIAAGLTAGADGIFGDSDDQHGAGRITQLIAKSADQSSRFEATSFGTAKLPKKIKIASDPRFVVV